MSSSDRVKLKMSAFSAIRSRWVDLGMTGTPCWTHQRSSTWAGVRPTRSAIAVTVGSLRCLPVPSELYDSSTTPCFLAASSSPRRCDTALN